MRSKLFLECSQSQTLGDLICPAKPKWRVALCDSPSCVQNASLRERKNNNNRNGKFYGVMKVKGDAIYCPNCGRALLWVTRPAMGNMEILGEYTPKKVAAQERARYEALHWAGEQPE